MTGDGCRSLASALRSDHCSLRELDLSFNHLADQGVQLLTEIQRDSRCSLEKLKYAPTDFYHFITFIIIPRLICKIHFIHLIWSAYVTILLFLSSVPLFNISVDQNEECWFDLTLLRQCKTLKISLKLRFKDVMLSGGQLCGAGITVLYCYLFSKSVIPSQGYLLNYFQINRNDNLVEK